MSNDDGHGKDAGKRKSGGMNIDTALVRELAELLNETGLTEIEVEDDDRKIRVSRGAVAAAAVPPTAPVRRKDRRENRAVPAVSGVGVLPDDGVAVPRQAVRISRNGETVLRNWTFRRD